MKGLLIVLDSVPVIEQLGSVIFGGEITSTDKIFYKLFNASVWTGCLLLAAVFINHVLNSQKGAQYKSFYVLLALAAVMFSLPFLTNTFSMWMPASGFNIMMTLTAGIATWMLVFLKHRLLSNYAEYLPQGVVSKANYGTDIEKATQQHVIKSSDVKQTGYIRWNDVSDDLEYTEEIAEIFNIVDGSKLTFSILEKLIHPDDKEYVKKIANQVLINDYFPVFYCRIVDGTDRTRHLSVKGSLNHANDGTVVNIECMVQEVDEEDLYTLKLENERKLQDIAWIQSHKMRAPVASILGLSHLFNKEDLNDPVNLEILKNITEAAHILDNAIKEVNDKTRY